MKSHEFGEGDNFLDGLTLGFDKVLFFSVLHFFEQYFGFIKGFKSFSVSFTRFVVGVVNRKINIALEFNFTDVLYACVAVRPSIVVLPRPSNPLNIAWFVMTIYVCAVNHVLRAWAVTHIRIKVLKLIPTLTNLYTTPTIVFMRSVVWVKRSLFHIFPSMVFGRVAHWLLHTPIITESRLLYGE